MEICSVEVRNSIRSRREQEREGGEEGINLVSEAGRGRIVGRGTG